MKSTHIIIVLLILIGYLLWMNYAGRHNGKSAVIISEGKGVKKDY